MQYIGLKNVWVAYFTWECLDPRVGGAVGLQWIPGANLHPKLEMK